MTDDERKEVLAIRERARGQPWEADVERLVALFTQRRKGRTPYGATPEEAAVVAQICRWWKGKEPIPGCWSQNPLPENSQEIALALNRLGVPTQTGKKWQTQTVQNVVERAGLKRIRREWDKELGAVICDRIPVKDANGGTKWVGVPLRED